MMNAPDPHTPPQKSMRSEAHSFVNGQFTEKPPIDQHQEPSSRTSLGPRTSPRAAVVSTARLGRDTTPQ